VALWGIANPVLAESETIDHSLIVRVYFEDLDMAHRIAVWIEPLESKYEKGFLILEVSPDDYNRLVDAGLKVEVDETVRARITAERREALPNLQGIPGYPCYRTVEETFATAQGFATNYPDLATWIDVGDSWERTYPGLDGYDMMVLRLTNSAISGPKPKIFITSAIHAREYTTAELITRLAEYLIDHYGTDADATWLLDYHDIHMMLHANPDGRKKAEAGLLWRKNTNQNYCSFWSNYRGADLNRNFQFQWGCCGGSSGWECDQTYRGPSPGSEPETQAIQYYILGEFEDQRGPNLNDPAPLDTQGIYLDIHSCGQLILWPWDFTSSPAPNGTELQTLGRKLAFFNDHTPQQGIGLYPADGTTGSFAYGEMGLPAFTFELGTEFFESCSYFENTLMPNNMPALIYAIKVARTPYMTPAGPDATDLALSSGSSPPGVPAGTPVTLSATIDDTRYNNTNGTEPTQNITASEYYLDVPPWDHPDEASSMSASDGSFDSPVESAEATIDTTGLSEGQHMVFIRGKDGADNWGAFSAIFLYISGTIEDCECDLTHDGRCDMQDWLLFGQDWGRTDCNDPGVDPCECDLTRDGRCDMQDWLLFGEDWGRTDCPVYP
jgi:hypothetical protein